MDPLGKPVGGDDHGAGVGVSGGYGQPNAQNTQAGMMAENEKTGFNAGVGGAHASGGLPGQSAGSTGSAHPIADQFMSGSTGAGTGLGSGQGKLDNSLDNFGGNAGAAGAGAGTGGLAAAGAAGLTNTTGAAGQGGSAVSGAYEGGEAQDALTGQSRAFETSEGVGYGGENLSSTLGVGAGAGAAGAGAGAAAAAGTGHAYGTGVGAEGGAGGHYDPATAGSGKATGAGAAGAGAGAGAAAGAAGAAEGTKQGHYGTTETDFDRGAPLSDPKEVDTGGPHSLVLDPATGKYIHRHEKEGGALADEQPRPE